MMRTDINNPYNPDNTKINPSNPPSLYEPRVARKMHKVPLQFESLSYSR